MKFLHIVACFFGLHDLEDCDECENVHISSIMMKCKRCGKIMEE